MAIHTAGLLLGNLSFMGWTGDITRLPLLRFPIAVIIVLGLWAGVGLARWVGLALAGYLAVGGWLGLISVLPIHVYPHQSNARWMAMALLLILPLSASLAFFALIHVPRESA